MATFWHNVPHTASTPVSTSSVGLGIVNRVVAWFRNLREEMAVRDELARLDDRDLHDLGISTSDFESIAHGTYRR